MIAKRPLLAAALLSASLLCLVAGGRLSTARGAAATPGRGADRTLLADDAPTTGAVCPRGTAIGARTLTDFHVVTISSNGTVTIQGNVCNDLDHPVANVQIRADIQSPGGSYLGTAFTRPLAYTLWPAGAAPADGSSQIAGATPTPYQFVLPNLGGVPTPQPQDWIISVTSPSWVDLPNDASARNSPFGLRAELIPGEAVDTSAGRLFPYSIKVTNGTIAPWSGDIVLGGGPSAGNFTVEFGSTKPLDPGESELIQRLMAASGAFPSINAIEPRLELPNRDQWSILSVAPGVDPSGNGFVAGTFQNNNPWSVINPTITYHTPLNTGSVTMPISTPAGGIGLFIASDPAWVAIDPSRLQGTTIDVTGTRAPPPATYSGGEPTVVYDDVAGRFIVLDMMTNTSARTETFDQGLVYVMSSTDGGVTWTQKVALPDPPLIAPGGLAVASAVIPNGVYDVLVASDGSLNGVVEIVNSSIILPHVVGTGRPPFISSVICAPHDVVIGQPVACDWTGDFNDVAGTTEWSAPGGDPPGGTSAHAFVTKFSVPGVYDVSAKVCNSSGCTKATRAVNAIPIQTEADMSLTFTRIDLACPSVPSQAMFDSSFHLIRTGTNVRMTEVGTRTLTTGSISPSGHLTLQNTTSQFILDIIDTNVSGSYINRQGDCGSRYGVFGTITPGFIPPPPPPLLPPPPPAPSNP